MGRTSDPEAADLDIVDVEAPATARGSARRTVRGRRRRFGTSEASMVVAAVAILAVAVAVSGGIGGPSPGPTPVTAAAEAGCRQVNAGAPLPAFRLAAGDGDVGVRGLPGESRPRFGMAYPAWQVPGPEMALDAPAGARLRLVLATGACVGRVEVDAADATAGAEPALRDRQDLLRSFIAPARPAVAFDAPTAGDWALRIVVEYWATGASGEARVEAFFRVRVGPGSLAGPTKAPIPIATPAVPCGPAPRSAADVVLTLTTAGSEPVAGVEPGAATRLVRVALGEPIEIAVAGDACATSWTIDHRSGASIVSIEGVANIDADPARAAQNRWRFTIPSAFGEREVVVILRFGPSLLVEQTWRVESLGFEVPAAAFVTADGRRVDAQPGCGLELELANGHTEIDQCVTLGWDGGGEPLEIGAAEAIGFEVPGWTIVAWSGECGVIREADGVSSFDGTGCGLGGFAMDHAESAPPPVRFVVPPGSHVLRLWVTAARDGDRIRLPYLSRAVVR